MFLSILRRLRLPFATGRPISRVKVAANGRRALDRPLLYAIGDIHGRADLLNELLAAIADHASEDGAIPSVVFLGDIIDRGPDSRACLDLVRDTLLRWPTSRFILGNHDDCLLSFFEGKSPRDGWYERWLSQGGDTALRSYGVDPGDPKGARRFLREHHFDHHQLLAKASIIEIDEDFIFVHAGVNPARRPEEQTRRDCLFIRKRFMEHVGPLGRVVVHGHTPQSPPRAVATENRISLDTGAYFSGVLTALVIDRRTQTLETLATRPDGGIVRGTPARLDRGQGTVLDRFADAA